MITSGFSLQIPRPGMEYLLDVNVIVQLVLEGDLVLLIGNVDTARATTARGSLTVVPALVVGTNRRLGRRGTGGRFRHIFTQFVL